MNNIQRTDHIDRKAFMARHYRSSTPIVITQGVEVLDVCKLWSVDYLKGKLAGDEVIVHHNNDGFYDHAQSVRTQLVDRIKMPFEQAVEKVESAADGSWYLQQASIDHQLPELKKDLPALPWLKRTKIYTRNFWLGNSGCVTPLHYDHMHNFLLQIRGKKTLTLFSPSDTPNLYGRSDNPSVSQVDVESPDYSKHPLFEKAKAYTVTLCPGDILYLPPNWWHQVRSVDLNISVNIWWQPLFAWFNFVYPFMVARVLLFGPKASKVVSDK